MACFTQLREKVPTWIEETNGLMAHVHAKRAEFAKAWASLPSRKRRAPDTIYSRSHRTLRTANGHYRSHTARPSTLYAGSKRNKVDSWSPSPELAVFYDGHTQKVLEEMVRQIWSAKSSLRQARISHTMKTTFRGKSNENAIANQPSRRGIAKESPFDFVDGQLNTAQGLCESGAYRFLREGDCLDELDGLVQAFEMILEASETIAERLEAEEHKLGEQEEQERQAANQEEGKCPVPARTGGTDDPSKPGDDILEVDDNSSTSSVEIDITAFRLNRFGRGIPSYYPR